MDIVLITVFMFASMMMLLLTGREIFIVIGAVGAIAALFLWGPGAQNMAFSAGFAFTNWYLLLTIPCFVFMGLTLGNSGVADKLFEAMYLFSGRIKGGLAMGTVGICALIATMTGESFAATATAGTIALPSMLKRKYDKLMVTGVVQAGGALGFLIPPSIVFILYGIIARVSIGHLWVAGILPGLLLAGMYIAYIGIRCKLNPALGPALPPEQRVSLKSKFIALRAGIAPIILIFMVLGLLFMGITTLVECAAIGAVGSLVIAAINRRLTGDLIRKVTRETFDISVMILWIFIAALLFSAVFDGLGAIKAIEPIITKFGGSGLGVIALMLASFVAMGAVLDDTAMLLIVAPLYIPIVAELGYSLVWFGVLYVITCQMAYITPPFGYNLFMMAAIAPKEISIGDIYRSIIPFVAIQAGALVLILRFPEIALWLPRLYTGSG